MSKNDSTTKFCSKTLVAELDQIDPSSPHAGRLLQMLTELNAPPPKEDPMVVNRPRMLSP